MPPGLTDTTVATFVSKSITPSDTEVGRAALLITTGPLLYHNLMFTAFTQALLALTDTEVGRAARLIADSQLLYHNFTALAFIPTPIAPC